VEIDDDRISLIVIPLLAVCELGAPWTGYDSENWSGAEISPATCRTKDEGNLDDQPRRVGLQGWHWLDPPCPSISCKPGKVGQTMAFKADTKTSRHQEKRGYWRRVRRSVARREAQIRGEKSPATEAR
jgi:hypothetical protein